MAVRLYLASLKELVYGVPLEGSVLNAAVLDKLWNEESMKMKLSGLSFGLQVVLITTVAL